MRKRRLHSEEALPLRWEPQVRLTKLQHPLYLLALT